jgi:hypothetical protein
MNPISRDPGDGVTELLAKANQIRVQAERMLREASAFDELKRLLGSDDPGFRHGSIVLPRLLPVRVRTGELMR